MSWQKTLDYLYSTLPMFHRTGPAALKPGLGNTRALLEVLGEPHENFRSIHIAGTNGKGSTSHIIASILRAAGYRVGLYTSPHVKDLRERIRINGKMIPRERVIAFVKKHKKEFERIKPSFFEMMVGLAFDHFSRNKVDIAVIETGLGGRLDSTNVLDPELSVITNISYDHTNLLGKTLRRIAEEKGGIIKESGLVVIGEKQKDSWPVFRRIAKKKNADLRSAEDAYRISNLRNVWSKGKLCLQCDISVKGTRRVFRDVKCDLPGYYQAKNIRTALLAVELLSRHRNLKINLRHAGEGLYNVMKNTGLRGRWEVLRQHPAVIADVAHNEAGMKAVLEMLEETPHENLHIIFGVVGDKSPVRLLKRLPKEAFYHFCRANIERAMPVDELVKRAGKYGLHGVCYPDVKQALKGARAMAGKKDLVLVTGSVFVVAEVM
ncbi:MAG: bifunctional folylpolyglutamate synthase/dihydrofolate synthase [Bacteroidia bacterium]|nr:bifunctional folylpolyglutamate synthase/dihydrofolate synthase [Bacteroidia bacterium]